MGLNTVVAKQQHIIASLTRMCNNCVFTNKIKLEDRVLLARNLIFLAPLFIIVCKP